MHLRRHTRRVLVPVQQVERERVATHEVVVDDERPDQIVAAKHVESVCHLGALEIAALAHLALQRGDLVLVDEHLELPGAGEVDERGHEARAGDSLVFLGRKVSQGGGEQRAAEAISEHIDALLAGRLLDGIERRQRALEHVVFEILPGVALVRIDP